MANPFLFIPTKVKAGQQNENVTIAFRKIENWAQSLPPIPAGGGGGGYASLTGPGQTTTPGDLTQAGGLTVNTDSTTSMGIQLNDTSSHGAYLNSYGSGGAGIFDHGGIGINIDVGGVGNITITPGGGMTINDSTAHGTTVRESGSGSLLITSSGSGGINIYNNGTGAQGISVFDNAPAGSGTGVSISSSYKNVIIGAGGISGSTGQVILQSLLNVGLGSVNTSLVVDPNGIHIGTNHTSDVVGFFGGGPNGQQTVTGSRGGNAALASLLTGLAFYGLIVNSSTP